MSTSRPAVLALEDGSVFRGLAFGADATIAGECVFNTAPDMARNFYAISARPGHARNLMVPDFAAYSRDGITEGQK